MAWVYPADERASSQGAQPAPNAARPGGREKPSWACQRWRAWLPGAQRRQSVCGGTVLWWLSVTPGLAGQAASWVAAEQGGAAPALSGRLQLLSQLLQLGQPAAAATWGNCRRGAGWLLRGRHGIGLVE